MKFKALLLSAVLLVLSIQGALAQLKVEKCNSAYQLVTQDFMDKGMHAYNVRYGGSLNAMGRFSCDSAPAGFIAKGIILTTGYARFAEGPNRSPKAGSTYYMPGDADLQAMLKSNNYDAASLEFDFVPDADSIAFNYVFASEEYPEFVGSRFNDAFALFISGPGIKGHMNLALLPDRKTTVSINTVNGKMNQAYFIANYEKDSPFNRITEYDGLTRKLTAGCAVKPHGRYHLKIVIADLNDRAYDSGVFLEQHSFKSVHSDKAIDYTHIYFSNGRSESLNLHINFATDSYQIPEASYADLDRLVAYLQKQKDVKLGLTGHTDSTGTNEHNIDLSRNRAKAVMEYLVSKGIAAERLSCNGLGASQPLSTNTTESGKAMNRRVELVFRKP